jgi:hypothetical protein
MTQSRYARVIRYNVASDTLRLEFPSDWSVASISGVNIAIYDHAGGALLASTAATLYTATTLAAAATAGDRTITLHSTAGNVTNGDRLRIEDDDCEVQSYNSTSKVATLKRSLQSSHAISTAVRGLWCTYALNTSTTATWYEGLECTVVWSPAGSADLPFTEVCAIESQGLGVPEYRERFAALYPSEFEIAEARLDSVYAEAVMRLQYRLQGRGLNIHRVVDQAIMFPAILDYMRWLIVLAGGNAFASEREAAWTAYLQSEESLCSQPVWVDEGQDLAKDEEEVQVHEPWRRGRGL